MDIMELGAIGELVGGVAVIGSLVYVALQVRQGNDAARSETMRAFITDWNLQVLGPMSDPVTGPLLRRANRNFEGLEGDEQLAAHGVWTAMIFLTHELWELDAQGKVSESMKNIGIGAVASYLKAPGPAQWWISCQKYFDPKYRAALNQVMEDPNSLPAIDEVLPYFAVPPEANQKRGV